MSTQGRVIICTVGASIIENLEKNKKLPPEIDLKAIQDCFEGEGNVYRAEELLIELLNKYYYKEEYKDLKLESAEVTSLAAINVNPADKLIFVAGTPFDGKADRGAVCARVLERYYNTRSERIVATCKLVDGFVITESKDAQEKPIKDIERPESLLKALDDIVTQEKEQQQRNKDTRPIVFNATPGFKLSAIYATLVGMAHSCEVYYMQVGMDRPFGLPAIPQRVIGEETITQERYNQLTNTEAYSLYDPKPIQTSSGLRFRRKNLVEILDRMPRASWEKPKILFLSASPNNKLPVLLDELREAQQELEYTKYGSQFSFSHYPAIREIDFVRLMYEQKATIVHFSGHGTDNGELCIEDKNGKAIVLTIEKVADLFNSPTLRSQVHCVVLNACYSKKQAEAIAQHIPYVIGMSDKIGSDLAKAFAKGFYHALGEQPFLEIQIIRQAFEKGLDYLRRGSSEDSEIPVLFENGQPFNNNQFERSQQNG